MSAIMNVSDYNNIAMNNLLYNFIWKVLEGVRCQDTRTIYEYNIKLIDKTIKKFLS